MRCLTTSLDSFSEIITVMAAMLTGKVDVVFIQYPALNSRFKFLTEFKEEKNLKTHIHMGAHKPLDPENYVRSDLSRKIDSIIDDIFSDRTYMPSILKTTVFYKKITVVYNVANCLTTAALINTHVSPKIYTVSSRQDEFVDELAYEYCKNSLNYVSCTHYPQVVFDELHSNDLFNHFLMSIFLYESKGDNILDVRQASLLQLEAVDLHKVINF